MFDWERKGVSSFFVSRCIVVFSPSFRNSRTTPSRWRKDSAFETVASVQRACKAALHLWGYRHYANGKQLRREKAVLPFQWT